MLKKVFLFLTVCFVTFFGLCGNTSASVSRDYLCKAESLGITTDKINIEFLYQEGSVGIVQNLYINIAKSQGGEPQIWDALYSTDADNNYWTTPVLREVATGISPFIIVQENGISPEHERLEADFYGKSYPVECTVRR